jgi:hypothetical protein
MTQTTQTSTNIRPWAAAEIENIAAERGNGLFPKVTVASMAIMAWRRLTPAQKAELRIEIEDIERNKPPEGPAGG